MTDDCVAARPDLAARPAGAADPGGRTGLLTDHYELTMLRAAIGSGAAGRRAVFEMFARQLPPGRRFGVVAGTGRFLDALDRFRFSPAELDFLRRTDVIDDATAGYLASYRFRGSIWGYGEGDCYFPGSPILVVDATFADAVMLETLALSIFNHDCAVASAAARMVIAAGSRPIIEMGSRRTHELAAVAAARAAYLTGFSATSNLRAGWQYDIPTAGTSAHAFTLVHDDERQAFAAQLASLGQGTTLLVDTYDVAEAVRTAVQLAGPGLGAVRIDSGDLGALSRAVRAQLDALGAGRTRIVATGDLDEHSIAALSAAPVDGYGVGTALVTGSGAPTAALVYKLAARSAGPGAELQPVAKRSAGKPTIAGRKWAVRTLDDAGTAAGELISTGWPNGRPDAGPAPGPADDARDRTGGNGAAGAAAGRRARPLLRELVRAGEIVGAEPIESARQRHRTALGELPAVARLLDAGAPVIPTVVDFEPPAAEMPGPSR